MSNRPSRLPDLLSELGRRRVFRTAALYTLLAIVIVEVTDSLTGPLDLPLQALPLVAWGVILGFPIAVGLAWTFDVTRRGIVRTAPESEFERYRRQITARVAFRLTLTGIAAALVGATTWTVMQPFLPDVREARAVAPPPSLPPGSVLVAPVRVGEGVDAALGERLALLLVQRLSGEPGLMPVDPRRTGEPLAGEAVDEARQLGAERVLEAALEAGAAGELRLVARLRPVSGGEPLEAAVDGTAEEIGVMVDRLVDALAARPDAPDAPDVRAEPAARPAG